MKLWQKISISTAIGLVVGAILPSNGGDTLGFLKILSDILISLGTYVLVPLVFVQVITSSYELRQDRTGNRFLLRTLFFVVGSALALSLLGGLCVVIFSPERIPIGIEEATIPEMPSLSKLLQVVFSGNSLQALSNPSGLLVAVFVFALIVGLASYSQKTVARPLIDFSESASKVLYHINRTIVEILLYCSVVLAATRLLTIRETQNLDLYLQITLLIGILCLLIVFVAYPLIIYLFDRRHKPFLWIRQLVPSMITGFLTGSSLLPLGFLMRSGNEELGLQRRVWQWYYPLATIVGRAGTALVSTVAFLLILHSHSRAEITLQQFAGVVFSSTFISFILGSVPGTGVLVSLSMMSSWYGSGIEKGFLILEPAAPILASFSVFLDLATQSFIAYMLDLMSSKDSVEEKKPSKFRDEFTIG